MKNHLCLAKRLENDKGVTTMEYAFLASLIAVVAIAGITYLGEAAKCTFHTAGGSIKTTIGSTTQFGPDKCIVFGLGGQGEVDPW